MFSSSDAFRRRDFLLSRFRRKSPLYYAKHPYIKEFYPSFYSFPIKRIFSRKFLNKYASYFRFNSSTFNCFFKGRFSFLRKFYRLHALSWGGSFSYKAAPVSGEDKALIPLNFFNLVYNDFASDSVEDFSERSFYFPGKISYPFLFFRDFLNTKRLSRRVSLGTKLVSFNVFKWGDLRRNFVNQKAFLFRFYFVLLKHWFSFH